VMLKVEMELLEVPKICRRDGWARAEMMNLTFSPELDFDFTGA
jgi:hypothetical protein